MFSDRFETDVTNPFVCLWFKLWMYVTPKDQSSLVSVKNFYLSKIIKLYRKIGDDRKETDDDLYRLKSIFCDNLFDFKFLTFIFYINIGHIEI